MYLYMPFSKSQFEWFKFEWTIVALLVYKFYMPNLEIRFPTFDISHSFIKTLRANIVMVFTSSKVGSSAFYYYYVVQASAFTSIIDLKPNLKGRKKRWQKIIDGRKIRREWDLLVVRLGTVARMYRRHLDYYKFRLIIMSSIIFFHVITILLGALKNNRRGLKE